MAADAAERAGGAIETLRLLRRALEIWPQVPDSEVSKIDLLQRIRAAAEQAGEMDEELVAVERLPQVGTPSTISAAVAMS